MGFSLIPREIKFFDLFDEMSDIIHRSAERFFGLVSEFNRLGERAQEIRLDQNACNLVTQRIITAIDVSFVTPFDRENIHTLANAANDLVDAVKESAGRFEVFGIEKSTDEAIRLARILRECCDHVAASLRLCREWKEAPQVMNKIREIVRLDQEADGICRECDRALFAARPDPIELIKWRELYRSIKEALKAARWVGQCLSEIIVKGD